MLENALERASELLPAQGPLTAFVHHNTLHAFEHLPFEQAVQAAGALLGAEPFLSEESYRQAVASGRIQAQDIARVLRDDLGGTGDQVIAGVVTRADLRLALMRHPVVAERGPALRWALAETNVLTRLRDDLSESTRTSILDQTRHWIQRKRRQRPDRQPHAVHGWPPPEDVLGDLSGTNLPRSWDMLIDGYLEAVAARALWRACMNASVPAGIAQRTLPGRSRRHRVALLEATNEDSDLLVQPLLIRLCAAYLDQGIAYWAMPEREHGFYAAFCRLYAQRGGVHEPWAHGLDAELRRLVGDGVDAPTAALDCLDDFGVAESEWPEFIRDTLLPLRGWAGMMRQVELRPDRVPVHAPPTTLLEFLAVRLLLDRRAVRHLARTMLGHNGPLRDVLSVAHARAAGHEHGAVQERAWLLYHTAQVLGWSAEVIDSMHERSWSELLGELEGFSSLERRSIFHRAYEETYYTGILDALSAHPPTTATPGLRFQAVFCIDEREESMRRHLEAVAPRCETYGTAGFFGLPIYFRGAADPHPRPLCPIAMRPTHLVEEVVEEDFEAVDERHRRLRKAVGYAQRVTHVGSRTFVRGALLTATIGTAAAVPLVLRVLFPRVTARLRVSVGRWASPPIQTHLKIRRHDGEGGEPKPGFSTEEMVDIVAAVLEEIGLTRRFAPLVVVVGHGSSSLNNPHEAAHDCGACGGGRGGPNARAFALMANDAEVRRRLDGRGLHIPDDTTFLGAYHNTCDDSMVYYDTQRLGPAASQVAQAPRRAFARALARNAHERARRFDSAPLTLSPRAALRHMEARAEDLAQPRPEYGHATNAVCIIGRRGRTRELFLDRRAFLVSYDPEADAPEGSVLARVLRAVLPVCAGINLEYYFSYVDQDVYGCGTKLPHNITGLLGVMDGHASDLRTGLPWQMVEIHDPVRLLVIVESPLDRLRRVLEEGEAITRLVRNRWFSLAALAPDSGRIHRWTPQGFEPYEPRAHHLPRAPTSAAWYAMNRAHLSPASLFAPGDGPHEVRR